MLAAHQLAVAPCPEARTHAISPCDMGPPGSYLRREALKSVVTRRTTARSVDDRSFSQCLARNSSNAGATETMVAKDRTFAYVDSRTRLVECVFVPCRGKYRSGLARQSSIHFRLAYYQRTSECCRQRRQSRG